ncbi:tetratricopeptide repeat protein [Planctopirus limnophila]|nr:tetratricopeptide repeat protein [Planctopirus limnophila]
MYSFDRSGLESIRLGHDEFALNDITLRLHGIPAMVDFGTQEDNNRRKKIANEWWKKGTEAMSRQNWDFAIEMFGNAVQFFPEFMNYRQALRGVEEKKYGNNKTGARMVFLKVNSLRGRVKKARTAKDWAEMDKAAEEGLALNPWDGQFNHDVGECCRERGFEEVATWAYEKAVQSEPENKTFLISLADIYEQRGNYQGAVGIYQRLAKLEPLNGSYRSKITQLGASQTIDRGGYEKAKDTQEMKRGYEHDRLAKAEEADGPGMSVEADLQRQIRKEPENIGHYVKLAEYYRKEGKFSEQAEILKKGLEVSNDPNLREQWEDVEILLTKRQLEQLRDAAEKGDANAKAKAAEIAKELIAREVDVFTRRIDRYPADLKIKFELAERYFRLKKYPQAIPLYQQAANDPRHEATVLVNLGKCFLAESRNDLARRQFEKAVTKLNFQDTPDPYKECHYILARLYEQSKDNTKAENHYNEVLAVDYSYKDTRERLEKIQGAAG